MTPLQLMLARHAVEIAECPAEHAVAVAEKHFNEAMTLRTFHGWVRYFSNGNRREYQSLLGPENNKDEWIAVFGRPHA